MGQRLKAVRRSRGFTLEKLEAESGVKLSTLGMYEGGHSTPKVMKLRSICKALRVNAGYILLLEDEPYRVEGGPELVDLGVE